MIDVIFSLGVHLALSFNPYFQVAGQRDWLTDCCHFSQLWFEGKRTVAGLSLGGEVVGLGWLVGWVGCTTSDSDTFQPFVAPASQDTRDKTAWKWHFSVGQPVCDIHRFETHSWQPFFPLRWQLTVSNVVPLFVKGSAWQPVEVIGAKPIILGHDRTQPPAWLPCLGAKQNSLFNPKHQITDLKLRGREGGFFRGGEKWFFVLRSVFKVPNRRLVLAWPLKSRNLAGKLVFGVVIYSPA